MAVITHTVQAGETLTSIAMRYGIKWSEIQARNPEITNPNVIRVGQVIFILKEDVPASPQDLRVVPEITAEILTFIVPDLSPMWAQQLALPLTYALRMAECYTIERAAAILAQIAHETGGFRYMIEQGRDSYFSRYDGRKDLGNIYTGDGARFRGRGFIQLTGRANYERCGRALGIDLVQHPELAEQSGIAAMTLAWYWNEHDLNHYADRGDFLGLTRAINGGLNGLENREYYHERALKILRFYHGGV